MKEHIWIISRGKRLSAMLHQPEGVVNPPVVVFCHGFTGEKVGGGQRNLHLANAMEAAGYAVVRFEFAGSGDSEGDFAADTTISGWKTDLQCVIDWVKEQPAYDESQVFILGHSLGGCIVLNHEDRDKLLAGRIALAPVIFPEENFRDTIIGPQLWGESLSGKTISHFYGSAYTLEPAFAHDIVAKKHSPLEACKSYQSPVLLIHGEEDAAVPAEGSRVFYQAYGGPKEFHRLAGADHGFSRHVSELKEKIIAWLRAQG